MPTVEKVRELIGIINLPITQIERLCGIPNSTLSQVLSGVRSMPEKHYKSMLAFVEKMASPTLNDDLLRKIDALDKRVTAIEKRLNGGEISIPEEKKQVIEQVAGGSKFFQERQKKALGGGR